MRVKEGRGHLVSDLDKIITYLYMVRKKRNYNDIYYCILLFYKYVFINITITNMLL